MRVVIRRLVISVLVLFGACTGYHGARILWDDHRLPPPGQMVSIGDHRLHVSCVGNGPAVILDAGAGAWSVGMRRLQGALSDSLRVCAYDRSGLGWSEAGSGPSDGATAVRELSALVDAAHIQKPFILVGHSLGANVAQIYAATRATDLKAVVLVDPGTPDDMLEDFSGSDSAAASTLCGWKCSAAWAAGFVGLSRVGAHWAGTKWMTDDENAIYKAALARPRTVATIVNTVVLIPRTAVQTKAARSFGSLPMSVFYSEKTRKPSGGETDNDVRVWHDKKLDQMRTLLRGTTHGRGPFVVPGATHTSVTFDSAAVRLIADEVRRLAFLTR